MELNATRTVLLQVQMFIPLYSEKLTTEQSDKLQVFEKLQAAKATVAKLEAEHAACQDKEDRTKAALDALKAQREASKRSTDPPLQPAVAFNTSDHGTVTNMADTPPRPARR